MQWDGVSVDELSALFEMDPGDLSTWLRSSDGRISFDVDKDWHAVHFVLTGQAWESDHPLCSAVLGGTEFGEDLVYGPARSLGAADVRLIATELEMLSVDHFGTRIDLDALAAYDVYPEVWARPAEAEQNRASLRHSYDTIRSGFLKARAAGFAMVITML